MSSLLQSSFSSRVGLFRDRDRILLRLLIQCIDGLWKWTTACFCKGAKVKIKTAEELFCESGCSLYTLARIDTLPLLEAMEYC
jgi:hypothetical protein